MIKLIIEHFDAKPEETIFIDDSAKNLINAQEMGINTVQFSDAKQLAKELKEKFNLLINGA